MSVAIRVGGEPGEALSFDGAESMFLIAPRAYAPGAPVELGVTVGDATFTLRGKARGSKRGEDGRFGVRVRLVSLRREEREALRSALPG